MLAALLFGLSLGLSAGLAPGPLTALVITQTLRYGQLEGMRTAAAPLLTDLPIIVLAVLLISALSDQSVLLAAIGAAGAVYLLHLARDTWRARLPQPSDAPEQAASLRRGAMTNFLNPHPWLFWATVGAPWISNAWRTEPPAAVVFLLSFYLLLVGAKVAIALLVGRWRTRVSERAYRGLMRVLAVMLALFAARLLMTAYGLLVSGT